MMTGRYERGTSVPGVVTIVGVCEGVIVAGVPLTMGVCVGVWVDVAVGPLVRNAELSR